MSVAEAQVRISATEFMEWQAYYALEPWGEERDDWRAGMIASTVANRHRNPQREPQYKPKDFMPTFERPSQSPKDMLNIMRLVTRLNNQRYEDTAPWPLPGA